MPLILRIASFLRHRDPAPDAASYCVGLVGNSRIRAVANYGKTGFEVSWQVVPARTGSTSAQGDRFSTAPDIAALKRAVGA